MVWHTVAMNGDGTIVAAGAYKNSELNSGSGASEFSRTRMGIGSNGRRPTRQ